MLVSRDERNQRWWMTEFARNIPTCGAPGNFSRLTGMSYSDDLYQWTTLDDTPLLLGADEWEGMRDQFHTFLPFDYGASDLYLLCVVHLRSGFR